MCLPELVQGIILTFGSAAYLARLSGKMMLVTALWMALTIWGGFVLVSRVYKHMASLRETEDKLYHDYQTVLEGRKELTLNRERAEYVFNQLYLPDAREYRHHIVRADTFHLSAVNWSNIMMLGAIGLVFWMANSLGWPIPPWRRPIPRRCCFCARRCSPPSARCPRCSAPGGV